MIQHQCIACGEMKESDKVVSCPSCGYLMFPLPYDRKELLIQEIRKFLLTFPIDELETSDLTYYRPDPEQKDQDEEKKPPIYLSEDQNRFPSLRILFNFTVSAKTTEAYFDRLNTILTQIEQYLHTPFQAVYEVDANPLIERIEEREVAWTKALASLDLKPKWDDLPPLDHKLEYGEVLAQALSGDVDRLLADLRDLVRKIYQFVRQNNLYGADYEEVDLKERKAKEDDPGMDVFLDKCLRATQKILTKTYWVDLASDGADELKEMLDALWAGISLLRDEAMLLVSRSYLLEEGPALSDDDFLPALLDKINRRYASTIETLQEEALLNHYSVEDLFDLYNAMIDLDVYGFMGINKAFLMVPGEYEGKLNKLIGLAGIKDSVQKIKAYVLANQEAEALNLHMCFYGNPGTGKTEVARIIAGILYENKILPTDKVIEVDRAGLVGQYVGETPHLTLEAVHRAMGGVLFIDEAYALIPQRGGFDYGHEAIATLLKAMEDYRGQFCVIFAGYKKEMLKMIGSNPGLRSRIQFELDFPNYSREELQDIALLMLKKRNYAISDQAMSRLLDVTDVHRKDPHFANAREIRNLLDQITMCQSLRTMEPEDRELALVDVNSYIEDAKINLPTTGPEKGSQILTGEEELDRLIGLASVKKTVRKIRAFARKNKQTGNLNLHMCFYGNPGTGKTEVARILSRIFYEAGVLPEAKLIETDAHGLIGSVVGETAPKTREKVQDAMGGVLFIDEAYGLFDASSVDGKKIGYGDEAVEVLLKDMEDYRGQFCIIMAGYKGPMSQTLASNPGLQSRIQFTLEFPDFSRGELGEIADLFLTKQAYAIDPEALDKILDITDYLKKKPHFANARALRNILDQVIMNQNLRTEDRPHDHQITLEDVEEYLEDEGLDLSDTGRQDSR